MIPLLFSSAFQIGKKVITGIKQKKTLINGAMAAKKIALQSTYIGTNIPLLSVANPQKKQNNINTNPLPESYAPLLTTQQKVVKFAPHIVSFIIFIALLKYVFSRR